MAGRPERTLSPDGGPLTDLALALRELRRSAGSPSYRLMAKQVHRSPTALSEAAGGVQVPTWDTVEAYVKACGADPGEWRTRWEAVRINGEKDPAPQAAADEPPAPALDELVSPAPPGRSRHWLTRRSVLIGLGVGLVLVVLLVGFLMFRGLLRPRLLPRRQLRR
jgi:Helix-turn-helix domain